MTEPTEIPFERHSCAPNEPYVLHGVTYGCHPGNMTEQSMLAAMQTVTIITVTMCYIFGNQNLMLHFLLCISTPTAAMDSCTV